MKRLLLIICAFVSAFSSTTVFAFDGQRKGFILGGGVGGGFLIMKSSSSFGEFTESNAVFLTEFKIGGAPSNTLEVFLIAKGSHLGESDLTLTAAGISKYFGTSETGLFVTGGVGLSAVEFAEGLGLFGGVGYEFSKHFSIQGDILYSRVRERLNDSDSFNFRVTLNALAF